MVIVLNRLMSTSHPAKPFSFIPLTAHILSLPRTINSIFLQTIICIILVLQSERMVFRPFVHSFIPTVQTIHQMGWARSIFRAAGSKRVNKHRTRWISLFSYYISSTKIGPETKPLCTFSVYYSMFTRNGPYPVVVGWSHHC